MRLNITLQTVVIRIAVTALVIILIAPSLKIRFEFMSDMLVYFVPFGIFAVCNLFANIIVINTIIPRISAAMLTLFLFAGPFIAFYVGGGAELDLLLVILLNMVIASLVILFPWDIKSLHAFIQTLAIAGTLISVNTLLFFGSDDDVSLRTDHFGDSYFAVSYLQTSFAMGLGVISATYLLVRSLNPFTLMLFAVNWLALAVGRGRGALIFCIIVSVLYLLIVISSKVSTFGRGKKFLLVVMVLSFIPTMVAQTMKVSRNSEGIKQIFMETDVEIEDGGRGLLFRIAFDRIAEAPIFGNGLGAYIDNEEENYPHNLFLQWAVDSGIVGTLFLVIFYLFVARAFFRSTKLSDINSINVAFAAAALSLYVVLNYMKSSDAYLGRDIYILSVLPIAAHLGFQLTNHRAKKSRRRRRVRRR